MPNRIADKDTLLEIRRELHQVAMKEKGLFERVQESFLNVLHERLNRYRIAGRIDEGVYRQKGNILAYLVIDLIEARSGFIISGARIKGLTDLHTVDLAFCEQGIPLVVGEAKMLGSPAHITPRGEEKPERKGGMDLDKRLKEVKYTPIDLKLRFGSREVDKWGKWIGEANPRFYTFWACRIAPDDNVNLIVRKFLDLRTHYNNGVGVLLFQESPDGQSYQKLPGEWEKGLRMDDAIEDLCTHLSGVAKGKETGKCPAEAKTR